MESCKIKILGDEKEYFGTFEINDKLSVNFDCLNKNLFEEKKFITHKTLVIDAGNKMYFSPYFIVTRMNWQKRCSVTLSTDTYFSADGNVNGSLFNLDLKFSSVIFYHPMLIHCFTDNSFKIEDYDKKIIITLLKDNPKLEFNLTENNIKKIEFGSKNSTNFKYLSSLQFSADNYVKLIFCNMISIEELPKYVQEFNAYCNAYFPKGLKVNSVSVISQDGICLEYFNPKLIVPKFSELNNFFRPIQMGFIDFLQYTYKNYNYRSLENKNEYILLDFKQLPSLEDEFLFYLRYLNLHIGKLLKENSKNNSLYKIIEEFVNKYKYIFDKKEITVDNNLPNEINSLRNHYVHEGYYLHDNTFAVTKKQEWLYDKVLDYQWLWRLVDVLKSGSFIIFYKDVLKVPIDESALLNGL